MTAALLDHAPTDAPPRRIRPVPVRRAMHVALGDSVTAGVGDAAPGVGWAAHLAALLGTELHNLGRNGARARDVVSEQLAGALALRPALATVFVGGNDVLRGDFDAAEVHEAMLVTVRAVREVGAQVVVVLPPPIGPDLPAPAMVRRVLGRRMELVRQLAGQLADAGLLDERCQVVDAQTVLAQTGPAVFHIDRIHPSPLGHRRLAELVAGALPQWPIVGAMSPVPPAPHLALRICWLIVQGIPWVARRSRDLLPELVRTVVSEERARARAGKSS